MSDEIWWRYRGEDVWQHLTSPTPITWTQEKEKGKCPIYYRGSVDYVNRYFYNSTSTTPWVLGPITQYGTTFGYTVTGSYPRDIVYFYIGNSQGYYWQTALSMPHGYPYSVKPLITQDNAPDDCGDCITTFNTGQVITAAECIEITRTKPECPCCAQLLPKATQALNILSGF